jgi:AcrR family transcriptional regulator
VEPLEKFQNLPEEKQNRILNAAMGAFAANGYKKASAGDIAKAAGISKAAVFHYFGNKRALYFYLVDFCSGMIVRVLSDGSNRGVTDFFEKIRLAADVKISVLKKHPAIFAFLNSMYFETDAEVRPRIESLLAASESYEKRFTLDGVDTSKFQEGIDPATVLKMLIRLEEGVMSELPHSGRVSMEKATEDFYRYLELLKNNFYRGEDSQK